MRVLITGGAGFIGSHVVEKCLAKSLFPIVVDNLSSGKRENINPSVTFYNADIRSQELLDILLKEKVDVVVHLAAQVSVQCSVDDPDNDASHNIMGTINVLECCRKANIKKIVFSSTAAVYGNPQELPVPDSHIIRPLSGYGLSKAAAEGYIKLYNSLHGLQYTILRYSNVYGPRQSSSGEAGVISIFINKALKQETIIINGDGHQTRDFIYVEDVAEANIAGLTKGDSHTVNISTGRAVKVKEVAEFLRSDLDAQIGFTTVRKGDIQHSVLDPSKAEKILHWIARIPFEEGIKRTVKAFKAAKAERI